LSSFLKFHHQKIEKIYHTDLILYWHNLLENLLGKMYQLCLNFQNLIKNQNLHYHIIPILLFHFDFKVIPFNHYLTPLIHNKIQYRYPFQLHFVHVKNCIIINFLKFLIIVINFH